MTETQYEDWLEDDASQLQEEKALNIRTPLSEQESEDIESEQMSEPSRTTEVYDTRDIKPEIKTVQVIYRHDSPDTPTIIVPEKDVRTPPTGQAPTIPKPTVVNVQVVKPSLRERIIRFFRRKK